MSDALETKAELVKLARLLELDPPEIGYLEALGPRALRKLRNQVTDLFFGIDAGGIARLAAHSDLFPPQLIAAITREAVGPFLAARIAGLVDPVTAVKVVQRLSPEFLADVAVSIDPRRASSVIGAIPAEVAIPVTQNLAGRGEWIVMGSFVGHVDAATAAALLDEVEDGGLLQIAFVMEDKSQLGPQIAMLADERIAQLIGEAARQKLWPEALDLMLGLKGKQRKRVVDIMARQPAKVIDSLLVAINAEGLWEEILRIASDAKDTDGVLDALARAPAKILRAMIDAVSDCALWNELRDLLEHGSQAARVRFFKRVAKLGLMSRLAPVADLAADA